MSKCSHLGVLKLESINFFYHVFCLHLENLRVGHMTAKISFYFLWKVSGNAEKSREILVRGLEGAPLSKPLLEVLLFFPSCCSVLSIHLPRLFSYPNIKEMVMQKDELIVHFYVKSENIFVFLS